MLAHQGDASKVKDSRANPVIPGISLAQGLVKHRRGFRPPGLLDPDGGVQKLSLGDAAGQPFVEQVGNPGAIGRNELCSPGTTPIAVTV